MVTLPSVSQRLPPDQPYFASPGISQATIRMHFTNRPTALVFQLREVRTYFLRVRRELAALAKSQKSVLEALQH